MREDRLAAATSGDLRADRRYLYAEASVAKGDHVAAAELFTQGLEIVPDWHRLGLRWAALASGLEMWMGQSPPIGARRQATWRMSSAPR
jgi:hypothetical protein